MLKSGKIYSGGGGVLLYVTLKGDVWPDTVWFLLANVLSRHCNVIGLFTNNFQILCCLKTL